MKTLQLDITFTRDYYSRHFGLTYDTDYFDDIRCRAETDMAAQKGLFEKFGDIGLGSAEPQPIVRLGYDDTLNTTLMFGGELHVRDGVSWVDPGWLTAEAADILSCPDIESTWPHTKFLEQHEQAVKSFGADCVRPPVPHGILESALDMRGQDLLQDMVLEPERVKRLLEVLTEAVIAQKDFWDDKCFGQLQKGLYKELT